MFEFISNNNNFLVEHSEATDGKPYISSDTTIDNRYYDDESTTPQNEQIGTFQDQEETFNDTHQFSVEYLEQTQQNQNTITFDTTSTIQDENITDAHDTKTDTHSFTVTTDSNLLYVRTRQIEYNNNDNQTTSVQNDLSTISTQNTAKTLPPILPQQVTQSYDPPLLPPQFSIHTTPHNSPQQGFSNVNIAQHFHPS